MNAWDDLPNAKHIDAVIEAANNPVLNAIRRSAQIDAWTTARDAAWGTARDAAWDADRGTAWTTALDAAWDAACGVATWDAIRALVAWDESADLLTMDPDAVLMIATIGDAPRKHQATLLYPYVVYLWRGRE